MICELYTADVIEYTASLSLTAFLSVMTLLWIRSILFQKVVPQRYTYWYQKCTYIGYLNVTNLNLFKGYRPSDCFCTIFSERSISLMLYRPIYTIVIDISLISDWTDSADYLKLIRITVKQFVFVYRALQQRYKDDIKMTSSLFCHHTQF